MNKTVRVFFMCSLLIMAFSCSRYVAPPFTDVTKISQLKSSMKVKQVVDLLGIDPYDIYYMQETGAQMFSFNYRLKKRIMYAYNTVNYTEVQRLTSNEDSQKSGDVYYDKKYQTVYVMFSKDGELLSYLTSTGASDRGELLIIGNSIQLYDAKNINLLDSTYNKAINPLYNNKPINIDINHDGSFNRTGPKKKWYDLPIIRKII